ncbi:MAG: hypothetical protein LCH96_08395 [Actinobacteria bacterium]|nr:hypothetical protein [Actinomycetota bacterium]
MPSKPVTPAAPTGGPGSTRARLRLGAVVLLGLLGLLYLGLAVLLYLAPQGTAVGSGLVGLVLAAAALTYGLLARGVVKQSRAGHVTAAMVCAIAAVLSISAAMAWTDWATLGVNVAAFAMLLGCVPRKASA